MKKLWKYLLLLPVLAVLLISCVGIIFIRPIKMDQQERLALFPTQNLPLEKPATIYWEKHSIPFIDAKTDADGAFLLGMVHAHLRLGQMELIRTVIQTRLAENFGPLVTDVDHSLKVLHLDSAVDSIEKILPAETRFWVENYVRGINYYQEKVTEKPLELRLLKTDGQPWQVRDILALGRLISLDVNWLNWFQWLNMQDKPYFKEVWQRYIDIGSQSTPSFQQAEHSFGAMLNGVSKSGSNALVVHGSKSADSCALIASDPHLGLQLPNTWLIAGFKCPSMHVLGFMFPGIPMVLIGRNEAISWAGTNMRSASSDLYEIPKSNADSLVTHLNRINVRWWRDKTIQHRESKLGPILSDAPLLKTENEQVLAMKWVGHSVTDEFTSFLKVNQSKSWPEFREAFKSYGVSGQNFLYADTANNIGMVLAVQIPNRHPALAPQLVLNPDSVHHHWRGVLKSTELPTVLNPPEGFIVSANNRPVINEPPIGHFFSADDRITRLQDLLRQKSVIDVAYLKEIQKDVFIPSALAVRDALLMKIDEFKLIQNKNYTWLNLLRSWNGFYWAESSAPVAFQLLLYHFATQFYTKRYDADMTKRLLSSDQINVLASQDLKTGDNSLLKTSLEFAVKKTTDEYPKFANWGEMHRLILSHPLENIPLIGGRFRFGDYPIDGSYNSAMKTAHAITNKRHQTFYGANSRFIACMKNLDENYFVLLGGQDGWVGSDQLVDQVPLWLAGEYIRIPFRVETIQQEFSYKMALR